MQMLGLRGASSSKQKVNDVQVASPGACNSAKALRLVHCDELGKFKMDAEAVAALQLVKGPLGVVSVCGRARQGKSFILNQLLGRSGGFQVASTHRPCTKGLWMWSTPLKRIASDGTEYSVLLLDSEGIDAYDQTGTYTTQIFSLAVLLSSMFVYNQMGGIDEAALDRLSLVTEMTKHIRVRASETRASVAELGQFSPIFLWLLRDFYLDLTEDGRRIMPREYLESALQPMPGSGKAIAAKNEIRESIRALFPDRGCFTLVRPIYDERDLQRLDQISLEKMRPEFRAGLDALTKFIFERTRPKQVGSTIMTGPLLAGLVQSFLDAINAGAVPTIATSWQNVEESECRRAHDMAIEVYLKAFDRSPLDEDILQEAYQQAVQNALGVFDNEAVGVGSARLKYEKLLLSVLKKQFEVYKHKVSLEAELKCLKAVEIMDERLRVACHSPAATMDQVLQVLNELMVEYERGACGPTKWKKLVKFLQQSLEGPLSDLLHKRSDQSGAENAALQLKCRSLEDRMVLMGKQLDAAQKGAQDWKGRYEVAVANHKSSSEEIATRCATLQNKCSTLEERCESLSHQLEVAREESSAWRNKHEHMISEQHNGGDRLVSELSALQSRCSAAEARLAAAREQSEAAKEEAAEWRRKYGIALEESHVAVEKATSMRERTNKQAQSREDALRAEFSSVVAQKDMDLKDAQAKIEQGERQIAGVNTRLKDQESKLNVQVEELVTLRSELGHLQTMVDATKAASQYSEQELKIIKQEKLHDEERLNIELKRLQEAENKCRVAEKESKRASEIAERARDEASSTEREKLEVERLAIERLAALERAERHIQTLTREKGDISKEVDRICVLEQEALSIADSLERRLEKREIEMEELLQSTHEQRANTVQVLESLLASERQARAEANARSEALSLQLQTTQGKLDALQQQLTSVRLNETALDTKLKTLQTDPGSGVGTSRSKRQRADECVRNESVQDMELDMDNGNQKKISRIVNVENGSSPTCGLGEGECSAKYDDNGSSDMKDSHDYLKFTILKLKQELTKAGFAAELLQMRNPTKKDILGLYEKLVVGK